MPWGKRPTGSFETADSLTARETQALIKNGGRKWPINGTFGKGIAGFAQT